MMWQDVEVSWITGITFSKRGSGVEIWQKTSFLEEKLRISDIHLQQQTRDTSK